MPIIISQNTTWSGRVVLTDDIQVRQGVTLTVAAGTQIVGNDHAIAVQGALNVAGTATGKVLLDHVHIGSIQPSAGRSKIKMNHAEVDHGSILQGISGSWRTDLSITNSYLHELEGNIRIEVDSVGLIDRNIISQNGAVVTAFNEQLSFTNNIVVSPVVTIFQQPAALVVGYGDVAQSSGNAFLFAGTALRVEAAAALSSTRDYFKYGSNAQIHDGRDDISLAVVQVTSPAATPANALVEKVTVYSDFALPGGRCALGPTGRDPCCEPDRECPRQSPHREQCSERPRGRF